MLARSGFRRKTIERAPVVHTPVPMHLRRSASFARADDTSEAIEKDAPARSEAYRRLVAALPCAYCRKEGRSQHAHTNGANKGKGIKNDDRDAMPLCADEPYSVGCHRLFDLYRLIPGGRDAHRRMGERMAAETRALIEASGQWPQSLERLPK